MVSVPVAVEDIGPQVCSLRDGSGLVTLWASPCTKRERCRVGFELTSHQPIFSFLAVLNELLDILRDKELFLG